MRYSASTLVRLLLGAYMCRQPDTVINLPMSGSRLITQTQKNNKEKKKKEKGRKIWKNIFQFFFQFFFFVLFFTVFPYGFGWSVPFLEFSLFSSFLIKKMCLADFRLLCYIPNLSQRVVVLNKRALH
jgi:hypothetical protein